MDYAEEYTNSEKLKRTILGLLLAAFVVVTHNKWVFPYISWYAATAHCHSLFDYSGIMVVRLSVFVGLPLIVGLLFFSIFARIGYQGLMHSQFPPPGAKVYKKTKILRGNRARIKSGCILAVPVLFLGLAIWGYFQMQSMPPVDIEQLDFSVCENNSIDAQS